MCDEPERRECAAERKHERHVAFAEVAVAEVEATACAPSSGSATAAQ